MDRPPPLPAGNVVLPAPRASLANKANGRTPNTSSKKAPSIPPGTPHKHSYLNGQCPEPGCSGKVGDPFWSPKKRNWFIRCSDQASGKCTWYRATAYHLDAPNIVANPAAPDPAAPAVPAPSQTPFVGAPIGVGGKGVPCAYPTCSTNGTRPVNANCANRMCLKDCVSVGPLTCGVYDHKKKRAALALSQPGVVPSQPIASATAPAAVQATQPPPYLTQAIDIPAPTPASAPSRVRAPQQEGPDFVKLRTYAREYPTEEWAAVARQQSELAARMQQAAQFRKATLEGTTIYVIYWAEDNVPPFTFERVVISNQESFSLSDDIDICQAVDLPPSAPFVDVWTGTRWYLRSPSDPIPIYPGKFLLFRAKGVKSTPTFDEFLPFTADPSNVASSSTAGSAINCNTSTPSNRDSTPPTSTPDEPPSSPSPLRHDTPNPFISTAVAATSSSAPPPSSTSTTAPTYGASPIKDWPLDYTVKEIHDGFRKMANMPRLPKGQGAKDKVFALVWPEAKWRRNVFFDNQNFYQLIIASPKAKATLIKFAKQTRPT